MSETDSKNSDSYHGMRDIKQVIKHKDGLTEVYEYRGIMPPLKIWKDPVTRVPISRFIASKRRRISEFQLVDYTPQDKFYIANYKEI